MRGYERMAEFHELFMVDAWAGLGAVLDETFAAVTEADTVVDLGAGSGLGVLAVATASRARVVAVEPSRTMRAMLTARISQRADLLDRVTIVAGSVPRACGQLPPEVAGFLCTHVLGHLRPTSRRRTFLDLAARLADDGRGVVTFASDDGAQGARAVAESSVSVGDHRYVERHRPGRDGRYRTEYEVWRDDIRLRRAHVTGRWQGIGRAQMAAELACAGLEMQVARPGVGIVHRAR